MEDSWGEHAMGRKQRGLTVQRKRERKKQKRRKKMSEVAANDYAKKNDKRKVIKRITITVFENPDKSITLGVENFAQNFWHAMQEMQGAVTVVAATFLNEAQKGRLDESGNSKEMGSNIIIPDKKIQTALGL